MTKRLLAALAMTLGLSAVARAQSEPSTLPASAPVRGQGEPAPPPATPAVPTQTSPSQRGPGAAAEFGDAGQVVIAVDLPFQQEGTRFGLVRSSISMGGGTSTIVVVRPSADWFITPHVSLGGLIGYARGDVAFGDAGVSSESSVTELMVGLRAGYDVHMTELISIWGRIELIYAHISGVGTGYDLPVIVNVPVLFHPAPHFFLGAGPVFSRDLVANVGGNDIARTTNYGLQGIIGGYLGD